jgi:hypothetical protein
MPRIPGPSGVISRLIGVPPQDYSIATDRLADTMLGARLAALEFAAFRFSRRTPPVVVCQI